MPVWKMSLAALAGSGMTLRQMLREKLVHLEHGRLVLAEDLLERLVGHDLPLIGRVL
jgi:hypothetical protein